MRECTMKNVTTTSVLTVLVILLACSQDVTAPTSAFDGVWRADSWLISRANPDEVVSLTARGFHCGSLLYCRRFWLTIVQAGYELGGVVPEHQGHGGLIEEKTQGLDFGSITVDGLQATFVSVDTPGPGLDVLRSGLSYNYVGVRQGGKLVMHGETIWDFTGDGSLSPADVTITWSRCRERNLVGPGQAGSWCR